MGDMAIKVDAREVLGMLNSLASYAPKAIAVALNRTAELATAAGRAHARTVFHVRSEQALRFALPQVLPGKLRATEKRPYAIIEPERIGKIYGPFEEGAIHGVDRLGRMPAVPTAALRPAVNALIPRTMFPTALGLQVRADASGRAYYALGKDSLKRRLTPNRIRKGGQLIKVGKRGTYEVASKTNPNQRLIFQRLPGQKRGTLLWVLTPSVPRPPILKLFETVQRTVDDRWANEMGAAFEYYRKLAESRGQA